MPDQLTHTDRGDRRLHPRPTPPSRRARHASKGSTLAMVAGAGVLGAAWWLARQARTIDLHGRVVVITGGSRGLGLHLAREGAAQGASLALIARDEQELARARHELKGAGAKVLTLVADVTDRAQVDEAIEAVIDRFAHIDVLINNAGIIQVGPLEHMAAEDVERSLAVHVMGPLHTTLAALPHFRKQGGGRIVNISSIGGKMAVPHLLAYCAGKFGLVGLSDGLRLELRRHNVLVTTVCPGLMRTGSPTQAFFKGQHEREYAWFVAGDVLPGLSISAETAARKILAACRRGDARLIVGLPAKAAVMLNELAPETMTKLNDAVNRLMPGPHGDDGDPQARQGWQSRGRQPAWAEHRRALAGANANQSPA